VKRRRLTELLAVQESIGLERNRAFVGREVEVLVDAVTPPRAHDHEDALEAAAATADPSRVSGRSREHKLVHLSGGPELVGRLVTARIEHAGPYALRGSLVEA
jgi:tRNA-2-methylthio-N6-dimethylallyladenosine synthase